MVTRAERLQRRMEMYAEEARKAADALAALENRPKQPKEDSVIGWQHQFTKAGQLYDYVAYRFGESARGWAIAGPSQQGKYYSWDELLDFIDTRQNNEDPIWIAGEWKRL